MSFLYKWLCVKETLTPHDLPNQVQMSMTSNLPKLLHITEVPKHQQRVVCLIQNTAETHSTSCMPLTHLDVEILLPSVF